MERSINFTFTELNALYSKACAVESGLRGLAGLLFELGVSGPALESARLLGLASLLKTQADAAAALLEPLESGLDRCDALPAAPVTEPEVGHVC